MKHLLNLFLNGNLEESLIDDYQEKTGNIQYMELKEQCSLQKVLVWFQENGHIERFLEEINSIKENYLYSSFSHGINHNERVLFWAYFLAFQTNLDPVSIRIVLDGAKYHDIGRKNDLLDPKHGARSASMIAQVVDDPIYQDERNLNLLKGIVELHSQTDKNASKIIKKYEIENEQLFDLLFQILKDADALDRVRLTYMKKRFSALNPNYLRISVSKTLLQAAHSLNEFYEKHREVMKGKSYEKFVY